MKISLLAFVLALPTLAAQAEIITLFRLPLGGTVGTKIPVCPIDERKRTALCWIENEAPPAGGDRFDRAWLPDATLPGWAAQEMVKIQVSKAGILKRISFGSETLTKKQDAVIESITSRFGAPSWDINSGGIRAARWTIPGLNAQVSCANAWCSAEFVSTDEAPSAEKELTGRKAKQDARPAKP